ncbi:unnamed protein product [Lactuca saligna]|uniref:Squalene monooxygenase n=1 Tax=Lactuca saligna TaxID=75948 RepID=A0AA35Z6T6_LACSI|nr:unnamed protein product [Lactuca saligna]
MPAEPKTTPGVIIVGDALNMRHLITGGGMSVALLDVVLLRDLLRPIDDLNDSLLDPRPLVLFLQVAAVGVYGVGRLLTPFPSPRRLWLAAELIADAVGIMFPVLKAEGSMQILGMLLVDFVGSILSLNK